MENSQTTLLKVPLHQEHLALNAKMGPFAGYDMPIQYSSVKEEVLAVRNSAGVFDVSHMGEFWAKGPDATKFVDFMMTNDFLNAPEGKAVYSPLCREDGTTIDDLIAYKIKTDNVLICVNASNISKDWEWFNKKFNENKFNCQLTNKSNDYSLLALQGPQAKKHLQEILQQDLDVIPTYGVKVESYHKQEVILARTGYTGEDGFEIFCNHSQAKQLWSEFLKRGVLPCGLASRDVLRLEACYPLYGHELSDALTPLDAGLKWTIKNNKPNFVGKTSLQNYSPKYKLLKLTVDKAIPRQDYAIVNAENIQIGYVTSGTHSVVLNKGICMALVESSKYKEGENILVKVRDRNFETKKIIKSFLTGGK